ncbi:hypothetical protein PS15m_012273 [Mucor circinelloides]
MHWGETKTWYSASGYKTAGFQDAMRKTVPELFKQQPDLISQRATMLSPECLEKKNVSVYAVDQRPGEFVVTYPQAYHSGFNHGFNLCETVNFADSSWIYFGLECVKKYKKDRRQPCFSHDNMLLTALQSRNTPKNGYWLRESLMEMRFREIEERKNVRARRLEERTVAKADIREGLQCAFCNCYCYLSYIGCSCTSKIACLDHVDELCTCDVESKMMHVQFTDVQLFKLATSAIRIDSSEDSWYQLLEYMLKCKTDLNIEELRDHIKRASDHRVCYEFVEKVEEFVNILDGSNGDAQRLLKPRQDSSKQTQAHTRYEQCQDLIETGKGVRLFKDILLPHIESYAAMLKDVDGQTADQLLASNNIDRQKAITSPYLAPSHNTVPTTSLGKKRKHKEVDSSNESTKPSKKSK